MINKRFKILRKLGTGRSQVYLAADNEYSNRQTAIKILPPDVSEDEEKVFREEFAILKNLNHPHIIKVHDFGTSVHVSQTGGEIAVEKNSRYFTLDYIEGKNIFEYLQEKNEEVLLDLIGQLCLTLFYLHKSNYVYFDLKCENVMVTEISGKPEIRLVDFGLTTNLRTKDFQTKKGTAEYLAPEILVNDDVDHRADLYSLGVLLYKIIYGIFPFEKKDQIELFRAHIESEVKFPSSDYSPKLRNVIKKLLAKKAVDRYSNTIEILTDLDIQLPPGIFRNWIPPKVFVITNVVNSIINSYLVKENTTRLELIQGPEGSGKSKLLEELNNNFSPIVLINYGLIEAGRSIWEQMLKRVYYSDFVYNKIGKDLKKQIEKTLSGKSGDILRDLKSIYSQIASSTYFILILDDFNLYDEHTIIILQEIIPILLINNIKIIVTENSDHKSYSDIFHSKTVRRLGYFTDNQILSYIEKTFTPDLPAKKIIELVKSYSEILPGAINNFITSLFFFEIIRFENGNFTVNIDPTRLQNLKSDNRHYAIARYALLSETEKHAAEILSVLESNLKTEYMAELFGLTEPQTEQVFRDLQTKNIIRQYEKTGFKFTSQNLKDFIYEQLTNKEWLHSKIAGILITHSKEVNRMEILNHLEKAGNYDQAFNLLLDEFNETVNSYSYKYKLNLLQRPSRSEYALSESQTNIIRDFQIDVLFNLDEKKRCLELIEKKFAETGKPSKNYVHFMQLKVSCLTSLGKLNEAELLLNKLLADKANRNNEELLLEKVILEFERGNYTASEKIINLLIEETKKSLLLARLFHLKGNIKNISNKNYKEAIACFNKAIQIYYEIDDLLRVSKIQHNIGVQYYLSNQYELANIVWKEAEKINDQIGNLDQDGLIKSNFGILFKIRFDTEKAESYYKRALVIFQITGNEKRFAITLHNYLLLNVSLCKYRTVLKQIEQCRAIFIKLNELNELAEIYFTQAKFLIETGNFKKLLITADLYEELFESGQIPEYHKQNISLLQTVVNSFDNCTDSEKVLYEIAHNFLESGNISDSVFVLTFIIINLKNYQQNKFMEFYENEVVIEHCKMNFLDRICMDFLLADILYNNGNYAEALIILEKNFDSLEEREINEFTWRYAFKLGEEFLRRGKKNEAFQYINLAKSLLEHISEQFNSYPDKNAYLSEPVRKSVLDQINTWENYFYAR